MDETATRWPELRLVLIIAAMLAILTHDLDQPLAENYIGRQIPTAMVALHLQEGRDPLRPELLTGPFPNLFLVEPPIHAGLAVGIDRLTSLGLNRSGRLVSVMGMLACLLGLFTIVRRRSSPSQALFAAAFVAFSPLTIRYGRAFHGDALAIGLTTAGLACWLVGTAHLRTSKSLLILGWLALSLGMACKVLAAAILVPLVVHLRAHPRRNLLLPIAFLAVLPTLLWYAHAYRLMQDDEAVATTANQDNLTYWIRALPIWSWGQASTWTPIVRSLAYRAFSPLGSLFIVCSMVACLKNRNLDPVIGSWCLATGGTLGLVAGKLHHEYYWLLCLPGMAALASSGWGLLLKRGAVGRLSGKILLLAFVLGSLIQAWSTFALPEEWTSLESAGRRVGSMIPPDQWVVAPEALLYQAHRRGCRLELDPEAQRRAVGEWGGELSEDAETEFGISLVTFYAAQGATYFADLVVSSDPRRVLLHDQLTKRYETVARDQSVLILRLRGTERKDHSAALINGDHSP